MAHLKDTETTQTQAVKPAYSGPSQRFYNKKSESLRRPSVSLPITPPLCPLCCDQATWVFLESPLLGMLPSGTWTGTYWVISELHTLVTAPTTHGALPVRAPTKPSVPPPRAAHPRTPHLARRSTGEIPSKTKNTLINLLSHSSRKKRGGEKTMNTQSVVTATPSPQDWTPRPVLFC